MLRAYTDVHVLNVGRGSCTVVSSPGGRTTMIDINDGGKLRAEEYEAIRERAGLFAASSVKKEEQLLDDPIMWFKRHYGDSLHRFILSHPDMDHLSGVRRLLSRQREIEVFNFWDYNHKRSRKESDFPTEAGWLDWRWYTGLHKGADWEGVEWPKRIHPMRGEPGNYWSEDSVEILSPTPSLVTDGDGVDEYNNASYVLRISHGPTSHLLAPSDAEEKAWNDMIGARVRLRANVLIAAHHGRNSGYHEGALRLIRPEVVIISSDEIPVKEDAAKKYAKHAKVFSTRDHGTLTVRMHDGGSVQILDRNNKELFSMSDRT